MAGQPPESHRSCLASDLQIHLHHVFTCFREEPEGVPTRLGAQILANIGVFENCKNASAVKRDRLA